MAYLIGKIALIAVLLVVAQSQGSQSIPNPDPSWDEYQVKECCPEGYVEVLTYCVQCNSPYVFDSIDQKCVPCPADHVYNEETQRCDCKVPCAEPRQLNGNNVCECPADQKGNKRVFNEAENTCDCPLDLPLWNGKYCVVCPAGTEYDPKEQQCYHCPEGFIRDTSSHACVPGF